ncbi:MAG: hypothetical protein V1798_02110 [Pseudomonadota bacterium]
MHFSRRFAPLFALLLLLACSKDPVEVAVTSALDASVTEDQKAAIQQFVFVAIPSSGSATTGWIVPKTCAGTIPSGSPECPATEPDPQPCACLKVEVCGFGPAVASFALQIPLTLFPPDTSFTLVGCGTALDQTIVVSATQTVTNAGGGTPPAMTFGSADLSACAAALPVKCP